MTITGRNQNGLGVIIQVIPKLLDGNKTNNDTARFLTLAASSASVEEQANSALKDGKFPDGSKPIAVERRIWRAQV